MPKCDFVFGNEDEFMHLAKTMNLVKPEEAHDTEQCFFGICQKLHDRYH
jgi:hypothetical protein